MDTLGHTLIAIVVIIAAVCGCWGVVDTARARRARRRRAEEFFAGADRTMRRVSELEHPATAAALAEMHRDLERLERGERP